MQRRSDRSKTRWRLLAAAFLALRATLAGADPADEVREAEELVRQIYYEGLPFDAARALTPRGAERLAEMLRDPAERSHAANIVIALGIAARPGAFEAIAGAAEVATSGEVDRPGYRLLDAVPLAMGHLARSDPRAFEWLRTRVEARAGDPGWSHGPFRGQRLADQQRRRAIAGLALSGRAETPALLDALAVEGARARRGVAPDPELPAAIDSARTTADRIASEGADAALGH